MEKVKSISRKRTIDILSNYLHEITGRKYKKGEKTQERQGGNTNKKEKEIPHTDMWHKKKSAKKDRAPPTAPGPGHENRRLPPGPPPKPPKSMAANHQALK